MKRFILLVSLVAGVVASLASYQLFAAVGNVSDVSATVPVTSTIAPTTTTPSGGGGMPGPVEADSTKAK
jgi:hypothetical protein